MENKPLEHLSALEEQESQFKKLMDSSFMSRGDEFQLENRLNLQSNKSSKKISAN